jgi:hypothetical protein
MNNRDYKLKQSGWRRALKAFVPFSKERVDIPEAESPPVQRKCFLYLRIVYGVELATIPVVIGYLAIRSPGVNNISMGIDPALEVFAFYVLSVSFLLCSIKWLTVSKWFNRFTSEFSPYSNDYLAAFVSYFFKIGWLEGMIFCGFILGLSVDNWFLIIPHFVAAGIALLLMAPTLKKWHQWLILTKQTNAKD